MVQRNKFKKKKKSSCIGVWLSTKISVGFSCGPVHICVAVEAPEGNTYNLLHVIILMYYLELLSTHLSWPYDIW